MAEATENPVSPVWGGKSGDWKPGNGKPTESETHPVSIIRLASDLADRANIAARAGLTFEGSRDLFNALGYRGALSPNDYRSRYQRGDIASRIVEAYPKGTWRRGAELIEDDDPEIETEFETAWIELEKRLNVWSVLLRADILAGLGDFSIVLIGAEGDLGSELPKLKSQESILYLSPYGPSEARHDGLVEDPEDERFGLPEFYKITRGTSRRVHWSRVLHVADGVLDDRVNGTPRLERVWNRLDDLDKVAGGGSEAFWLRVHGGLMLSIDKDLEVNPEVLTKFKNEAEEFSHQMRRVLAGRGFDAERLGGDVANFGNQVSALISLISGATGIPQRLLLGSERGQLASSQDKATWDERVSDRRGEFAEPVVRQFVDRLIKHNALPEPEQYDIRWPEIEDLDEKGKAEVAAQWAGLNTAAKGIVVKPEEIRDRVLRLDPLDDLDVVDLGDPNDDLDKPDEPDDTDGGVRTAGKGRPRKSRGGKRFAGLRIRT